MRQVTCIMRPHYTWLMLHNSCYITHVTSLISLLLHHSYRYCNMQVTWPIIHIPLYMTHDTHPIIHDSCSMTHTITTCWYLQHVGHTTHVFNICAYLQHMSRIADTHVFNICAYLHICHVSLIHTDICHTAVTRLLSWILNDDIHVALICNTYVKWLQHVCQMTQVFLIKSLLSSPCYRVFLNAC